MHAALHLPSRAGVLHFLVQSFALLCLSYITAISPVNRFGLLCNVLHMGCNFLRKMSFCTYTNLCICIF